jgi:hypothetical protein
MKKIILPLILLIGCSKSSDKPAPPPYVKPKVLMIVKYINGATASLTTVDINGSAYGSINGSLRDSVVSPNGGYVRLSATGGNGTDRVQLVDQSGQQNDTKINATGNNIINVSHFYTTDTFNINVYRP